MLEKKIKSKNKVTRSLNDKGSIIAYILVASSVVATLLGGLLVFTVSSQRRSSQEVFSQQALQIAESGVYYYKWYLAHNLDGKNAQQIKNFWESTSPAPYGVDSPYEQEVVDSLGVAIGKFILDIETPNPESTIVFLTSTGVNYTDSDFSRSIKVRFRRPSWSEYSVLANDVMRFGEGTNVMGPIHSNKGIRFDGVAHNVISSSVETYVDPDSGITRPGVWTSQADEATVFLAGKEYPTPAIDFNGATTDLSLIRDEAQSSGVYLAEDTFATEVCGWVWTGFPPPMWGWDCYDEDIPVKGYHLTLRVDDKIEVRRVFSYSNTYFNITDESSSEIRDIPDNGLIFANKHIWVDGQIDSTRVTIASADLEPSGIDTNIYINNDILYTNKDGSDTIGLIAENDITVGYYSENDLEINAALLAQKGRVGREYYGSGSYRWRDKIAVFGSIATNERYGFAYTDGTGYDARELFFDNNLLYYPPPYFPTGTTYELDLWEDL